MKSFSGIIAFFLLLSAGCTEKKMETSSNFSFEKPSSIKELEREGYSLVPKPQNGNSLYTKEMLPSLPLILQKVSGDTVFRYHFSAKEKEPISRFIIINYDNDFEKEKSFQYMTETSSDFYLIGMLNEQEAVLLYEPQNRMVLLNSFYDNILVFICYLEK